MEYLFFIAGLVLLVAGAEVLVRGASKMASAAGVSPLVIGLTVVAFGTSAPEMAVSVVSSLSGQADIALGNVVGSNIFNVLFILGVSALIVPLNVSSQLIRLDVPVMILVSVICWIFSKDGVVGQSEGVILFAGIIVYTAFLIFQSRRESQSVQNEFGKEYGRKEMVSLRVLAKNGGLVCVGLILLVLGSKWLVAGAVTIAQKLGVSDLVIGLTIVAAGTSLPELATSVVAGIRGERDIAVGNVVGSNIFNVLAVLGLSAAVSSSGVAVSTQALRFDIPVMIVAAIVCLPVFFTGHRISRAEGFLILAGYGIYVACLVNWAL